MECELIQHFCPENEMKWSCSKIGIERERENRERSSNDGGNSFLTHFFVWNEEDRGKETKLKCNSSSHDFQLSHSISLSKELLIKRKELEKDCKSTIQFMQQTSPFSLSLSLFHFELETWSRYSRFNHYRVRIQALEAKRGKISGRKINKIGNLIPLERSGN